MERFDKIFFTLTVPTLGAGGGGGGQYGQSGKS